jgi:hypothetical protein
MNQKKFMITLGALLLLVMFFTGYVAIGADYGSKEDPVITLSYLTQIYGKQTDTKINSAVSSQVSAFSTNADSKITALQNQINSKLTTLTSQIASLAKNESFASLVAKQMQSSQSAQWQTVKLASGKTLKAQAGTQMVLRVGTAVCSGTGSVGLVNLTGGGSLAIGSSLTKNYLYMADSASLGVKATSAATFLVTGKYTIA